MAIGCRPPAEVTEIRASGGMLRAHVNPWPLLAPLPFTSRDCASLAGRRLGDTGVGYIQLGGGSCSKPRFIPATPVSNTPSALCMRQDKWGALPSTFLFASVRKPLAS